MLATRRIFLITCLLLKALDSFGKYPTRNQQESSAMEGEEHGECSVNDGTCSAPDEDGAVKNGDAECIDFNNECQFQACIDFFPKMSYECRKTCLLCDSFDAASSTILSLYDEEPQQISSPDIIRYSKQVDEYMYKDVFVNASLANIRNDCKNRNDLCLFWASIGECQNNPDYMEKECAPACFSCHKLSFELRCPYDKDAPKIWSKAGDLDAMFTRIVTEPEFQQNYNITILSEPDPELHKNVNNNNNNGQGISKGPWVVVVDDFLTSEECDTLRDLGSVTGYKRSEDVGERNYDGTYKSKQSEGRTSSNAWCTQECAEHNVTVSVHDRMHHLLQIPPGNYEYLQLLKYEVGQFYEIHHDYINFHQERFQGVRILTVFLYLNDVEEGGGTNFPKLDLTVEPRKGRALLWPSVLDAAPDRKDGRTDHQALPVLSGIKYGANAWVHQRDFKGVWAQGCH